MERRHARSPAREHAELLTPFFLRIPSFTRRAGSQKARFRPAHFVSFARARKAVYAASLLARVYIWRFEKRPAKSGGTWTFGSVLETPSRRVVGRPVAGRERTSSFNFSGNLSPLIFEPNAPSPGFDLPNLSYRGRI